LENNEIEEEQGYPKWTSIGITKLTLEKKENELKDNLRGMGDEAELTRRKRLKP